MFFLVLLPLIGFALELLFVLLLLWSGLASRVILGRLWVVEAENADDPTQSATFAVKGWRRSGRAIGELERAIAVSSPPDRLSEGLLIGSADPGPG